MSYALPDSRVEDSSLFVPNFVPVGNYKVDPQHLLAQNMTGYFLPGNNIGGNEGFGVKNLAGYSDLKNVYPGAADPTYSVGDRGRVVNLNDQSLRAPALDTPEFISAAGFTYAVIYKLNSHQSKGGSPMCRARTSSSSATFSAMKDYSNRSQVAARINNINRTITYNTAITLGSWVFRIGLYDRASGRMQLWDSKLGLLVSTNYSGNLTTNTSANTHFRIAVGAQGDANRGFDGQVAMGAIWNGRGLSEKEIEIFFNAFKCVLVPE